MVTTVAPTMPVLAAINIPTKMTANPRPPRKRPASSDIDCSNDSAMRVRSNATPMKMNRGTATSV